MKKKILISPGSYGKINNDALDLLSASGFEYELNPYGKTLTEEQCIELLADKVGLIAGTEPITRNTFEKNPQLKYVCRFGVGMNNVDLDAANSLGIPVENTPSGHVEGVAELCLGGMLSICRHIGNAHHQMKTGIWRKPMGNLLKEKVIGMIGFGQVAKRLAELLQPFNVTILALDVNWDKEAATRLNVQQVELKELLGKSDIVSLHLPLMESTKNTIGKLELDQMKEDVIVVNTSRGGLIDEDALYSFLSRYEKSRAYIDTFDNEPYNGPLVGLDNILLTPHMGSYAKEVRINMEMETVEKTIAFFK